MKRQSDPKDVAINTILFLTTIDLPVPPHFRA
jgi:hypothetical protein